MTHLVRTTRLSRPHAGRGQLAWRWCSRILLLWGGLCALLTPGLALARPTTGGGQHGLTPAAIAALHQALKARIGVHHTGAPRKAATAHAATAQTPIRPLASNLPAYNNIGISDASSRGTASLDSTHHSYSASVMQDVGLYPGITVTSQNITYIWPAVAAGQADNWSPAGQVIPVSGTVGAATVGILGVATNGNATAMLTLTYTDSSTATVSVTLTDWWSGTPASGNQAVVTLSSINTHYGTRAGTYYLYSTTAALNTSKVLQSVTLPTSVTGGQLHVFAVGVGGPAFNNIGISDDGSPGTGSFDNGTASYSAQALSAADVVSGQQFDVDGIAYPWPTAASGAVDNWKASSSALVLPVIPVPGATTLGVLGAAANGNASGTATLTYTDGSTSTFTLGLTDWGTSTTAFGNLAVSSMSYRNTSSGKQNGTFKLYVAETSLNGSKTLQSLTLPTSITGGQLHVFALGTRSALNDLGTSNTSQPGAANYDGTNHTGFSIQSLESLGIQQGQSLVVNGVSFTWPASYGSMADNYVAAGQTIAVTPVANATMIGFLGAAANGNTSGTTTLTYTDGSTSTFTLSLSDWWYSSLTSGESVAASMTSLNGPGGANSVSGTFKLYEVEASLTAGKTLQSVTLPSTSSPGLLHIFAIGTRSQYNNIGISDTSNTTAANFDGWGNSYSAEDFADPSVAGWNPGDTLTYEGINYVWPGVAAGQDDNYVASGQTIPVSAPAGATTLGFVGAADNGTAASSGTATLTYTDGSTSTFTLGLTDWTMGGGSLAPLAGNRLFAILPHQNGPNGTSATNLFLFEVETPLNASKTLQSVTLPSSVGAGRLHIFMLGTRTGENYPNNIGTSDDSDPLFASVDGSGASYSIEALEAAGLNEGQPFTAAGVSFAWPASYSVIPDNFQAAGQTLPVTPVSGATTLAFLGAATNGTSSGTVTITYTDGSTSTFTLSFADWCTTSLSSLPGGDQVAATMTYRNSAYAGQQSITNYLFVVTTTLTSGKTVQSVTLPSSVTGGQLHVFALGTA